MAFDCGISSAGDPQAASSGKAMLRAAHDAPILFRNIVSPQRPAAGPAALAQVRSMKGRDYPLGSGLCISVKD